MLKGIVGTARQNVTTSVHEVWLVKARSEQQQEQLDRAAEEAVARLESMHEQARCTVQSRQRLPGQKCKPGTREQTHGNVWGKQGAVGAEEQVQREYLNTLMEEIGAGTVDCITSAKWDEECGRAVVPISGVNTTDEPMVFRGGQRIADATKLHSSTVNNLTEHRGTVRGRSQGAGHSIMTLC